MSTNTIYNNDDNTDININIIIIVIITDNNILVMQEIQTSSDRASHAVDVSSERHELESVGVLVDVLGRAALVASFAGLWRGRVVVQLRDGHAAAPDVRVHGARHAPVHARLAPAAGVFRPGAAPFACLREETGRSY